MPAACCLLSAVCPLLAAGCWLGYLLPVAAVGTLNGFSLGLVGLTMLSVGLYPFDSCQKLVCGIPFERKFEVLLWLTDTRTESSVG